MESRISVVAIIAVMSVLGVAAYEQAVAEASAETASTETYALLTGVIEPVMQLLPLLALIVVAAAVVTAAVDLA